MIRLLDILLSIIGLCIFSPLLLILCIAGWIESGSPLFFQERVGRNGLPFVLVKFRTMKLETKSVATHLSSSASVTKLGKLLRRSKLDELPQLWNVAIGEMSLVGPRPCLYNQGELIYERKQKGVLAYRPGITGLAQIKKIDMSTPKLLAEIDANMILSLGVRNYFKYIFLTLVGEGWGDNITKEG